MPPIGLMPGSVPPLVHPQTSAAVFASSSKRDRWAVPAITGRDYLQTSTLQ